ncbi:MAG: hypothetical protein AAF208_11840 [Cyanobacteria bacterium P01_A01_bin.45]
MGIVIDRFKYILCLTSTAVTFPEIALSQDNQNLYIDEFSKLKKSANSHLIVPETSLTGASGAKNKCTDNAIQLTTIKPEIFCDQTIFSTSSDRLQRVLPHHRSLQVFPHHYSSSIDSTQLKLIKFKDISVSESSLQSLEGEFVIADSSDSNSNLKLREYIRSRKPLLAQKTVVKDLKSENSNNSESTTVDNQYGCISENTAEKDFTRVIDLISDDVLQKDNHQKSCNLSNIRQIEFSNRSLQQQTRVSDLEEKQAYSKLDQKFDKSENYPSVQELDKKSSAVKSQKKSPEDEEYILPPHIVPNKKVHPLTTALQLNGNNINHLTTGEFLSSTSFGNTDSINFDINAILKINSRIEKSINKDNVLFRKQTGEYLQLQTLNKKREVLVQTKQPQTLNGIDIQLSLTGSCLSNPNSLCTFTPSLITDDDFIDPISLQPTEFLEPSQFGDVVTPASAANITQPGFQSGIDGQEIGINLSFPNIGSSLGNTQSSKTFVTRKEVNQNTPTAFYSTVRQVFKANDKRAVVGRTVRGFGLILDDDNSLLNSSLQLTNLLLPDAEPPIKFGVSSAKKNINKNLFFAVNNIRQPNNSLTIYHAGLGSAKTPSKNATKLPNAHFNSVWFGLSPVKKIKISGNSFYEFIGNPRITAAGGSEGGADFDGSFITDINGQTFTNQNLDNVYTQIYLTGLERDANFVNMSSFQEETNYYPHIGFSGNITGNQNVWRYYGGFITSEKLKAYLGADFTKNTLKGWNYSFGGIAYTNPDRDYYSQIYANLSKKISLNKNSLLLLFTGFDYAIDGNTEIDGIEISNSASSVRLGATIKLGSLSLGVVNYFGDILPNSLENSLLANLTISLSDRFQVSGYYKPIDESDSSSRYGASAVWKINSSSKSPIFSLSWTNNDYQFGKDANGNKLGVKDNRFTIFLKGNL